MAMKVFVPAAAVLLLLLAGAQARRLEDGIAMKGVEEDASVVSDAVDLKALIVGDVSELQINSLFQAFVTKFKRAYVNDVTEMGYRLSIFTENIYTIAAHNMKADKTYTLGITDFVDTTWEEFKAKWLTLPQNCSAATHRNFRTVKNPRTGLGAPKMVDWALAGVVSPVKSQGHCGSCWTFSATGALESAYTIATNISVDLSEQQLLDCAADFDTDGCKGGLPSHAFEYIKYAGGIESEEDYPYVAGDDGKVHSKCKLKPKKVVVEVEDSFNITIGDEGELFRSIADAPVSVAIKVIPELRLYTGGVFLNPNCSLVTPDLINHAALATGYDLAYIWPFGLPHYKIKNSWGESWGEAGYFKLALWKDECGVAQCASYPIIVPPVVPPPAPEEPIPDDDPDDDDDDDDDDEN